MSENVQIYSNKQLLDNVVIIRPILIILLVFYHAFAIYSGAWAPIEGFPEVPAYWWLDKLSYAFMLEMFVFVSGYVFGFQIRTKGEVKLQVKQLFWGKFKRLMMPCMVFSLLYILLFGNIMQPVQKTLYSLLNGVGHMWFLPMLFWCFVGIKVIEKLHLKPKWTLPLLLAASLVKFLPLPLRMGSAMYYLLFFYVGYILQREDIALEKFNTLKHCLAVTLTFLILFPSLTLLRQNLGCVTAGGNLIDNQFVVKVIILSLSELMQVTYAFVGLWMLLVWVGYAEKQRKSPIPQWITNIGNLCFGVYLLQQFILKGLYDHTNLPGILGCYWLPWVGFVVALMGSVAMAQLLLKTKIGRFLIG